MGVFAHFETMYAQPLIVAWHLFESNFASFIGTASLDGLTVGLRPSVLRFDPLVATCELLISAPTSQAWDTHLIEFLPGGTISVTEYLYGPVRVG